MARRRLSKFIRGAVNTGTAAAPLGPKVAIPLAIGGGALEAFSTGDHKFNRKPYDTAFKHFTDNAWKQTRRASRELASQSGARMSAMGYNESPVGGFLHDQSAGRLYAGTLDHINTARANLESQIAHATDMMERGASAMERNKWMQTRNMLMQKLDSMANPEPDKLKELIANLPEMARRFGFPEEQISEWVASLQGQSPEPVGYTPLTERDHTAGQSGYAYFDPKTGQGADNPIVPTNRVSGTPVHQQVSPTENLTDEFPMMKDAKTNVNMKSTQNPTMAAAQATLGSFITQYLTNTLGEEFADIFVWE